MSTPTRRAIYGAMAGDTTLNGLLSTPASGYTHAIYHTEIPQDATFPAVIFSKSSGVPTEAFADPDALETDVWLVKAVDKNTTADVAEAVASRIIVLLNDNPLSISGLDPNDAPWLYLRRQSDVEYTELVSGVTYYHVGSLFRLVTTN